MSVILEAIDVCKYFGGLKAVEKVSMQVQSGDIFGIIGPNGAGKTTFFNLCTNVYSVTSGRIIFDGTDITHKKSEEIARLGMARTFQNIHLFNSLSVLDNIKVGFHIHTKTNMLDAVLKNKRCRQEEAYIAEKSREILKMVGLEAVSGINAGNLAYGMQRKVEIARALALNPKVLLLDEPVAGMNITESAALKDFINMLNGMGYTIVVIEHDMRFVMSTCNNILAINFGQKICEGVPGAVVCNEEVIKAYFGKQTFVKGAVNSK
ncbi:MAG: ABC transporter ATP-binding protein [Candidatus Pelethousia sp.]|nr:ABC transporter ATP-binding protein [Candidatus Pelethousia sp.]